jgi:hypothetical protein
MSRQQPKRHAWPFEVCRSSDCRSEFCGNPERHEYELYLAVEDIDHSRAKTTEKPERRVRRGSPGRVKTGIAN